MTKQEWQKCFEPAPAQFEACIQRALAQKERGKPGRVLSRAVIIAVALMLALMGMALATGGRIFGFLNTDDIGEVKVTRPKCDPEYTTTEPLSSLDFEESVCDGITAHIMMHCTIDPEKGVLRMAEDVIDEKNTWAQTEERAYLLSPILKNVSSGSASAWIWDTRKWWYDSQYEMTIDICFPLVKLETVGDTLKVEMELGVTNAQGHGQYLPFTVEVPVQRAGTKTYTAVNTPIELENYRVNSAKMIRTDMACYFYLDVQEDYDQLAYDASFYRLSDGRMVSSMILPLQHSYWIGAADETGMAYSAQLAEKYMLEDSTDDWMHYLIMVAMPPFETGGTVTMLPYDSESAQSYQSFKLNFEMK